ncbi:MAG: phytanoyl-CoA dioxygenase family protein [Chthonomonadales bacterium]|nr:phytanoyl-CoA dioxygenase family protein [Chthonomonadales bacterium]
MALTEEQRTAFWRDGFLPMHGVLTRDELGRLRERTDQIVHGNVGFPPQFIQVEPELAGRPETEQLDPALRVRKMWELTRHDPVFAEYARHPFIVEVVRDLLGPDLKLFADQMLLKPAFHGSAKPYHQDSPYWPIEPMELVTCWMALDDATLENGCMRFLPGTHRLGPLPHHHLNTSHLVPEGWEEMSARPDEVALELKAGSCSFHHSLVLHETSPNRSAHPRRAITTAYMRSTSRYAGKGEQPDYLHIAGRVYPGCV